MSTPSPDRDYSTGWTDGRSTDSDPALSDAATVATRMGSDVTIGLSTDEATRRLSVTGPNAVDEVPPIPAWRRFAAQFRSPLIRLLLAALAVSVAVWVIKGADGWPVDGLVIAGIVTLNGILGYTQETRAQRATDALARMASATTNVVRDGRRQRIPVQSVVPGDLLLLAAGDTVPADARLVGVDALEVSEAGLTGASEPVPKTAEALQIPADSGVRLNIVYQGSTVTKGTGRAIVTATATTTHMGHIAEMVHQVKESPTPLQREISRVTRSLGIAVLVVTVVVVVTVITVFGIRTVHDVVTVVLFGVSLAVAAIPEGLPAMMSVVLTLGARRMADQCAIVKDLPSVEALGSASVVCTGKTGVLTTGILTVGRFVSPVGDVALTCAGYQPDSVFGARPGAADVDRLWDQTALIAAVGSCTRNATADDHRAGSRVDDGDPVGAAFVAAQRQLATQGRPIPRFRPLGMTRFGDGPVTATLAADENAATVVALRGDPQVVLACCGYLQVGHDRVVFDDKRRAGIHRELECLTATGLFAEAVAYGTVEGGPPPLDIADAMSRVDHHLVYAGLAGIIDPPRAEVAGAIAEAKRAGVRIMMITGDQPHAAARTARDLGISDDDRVLSGAEIADLDHGHLHALVRRHCQFSQLAPEHKVHIIDALHAEHEVVAVTGEGINDAPALKSADIGVAMGRTGTDVARAASNMILADDNFATVIAAIREGRGVFANIKKFLRYLLSSNVGEVLTVFFAVVFAGAIGLTDSAHHLAVPLLPTQILWINLLTDGAPAMALGVDPQSDDLMGRAPRTIADRIVDRRMWQDIAMLGSVMAAATLCAFYVFLTPSSMVPNPSLDQARTAGFTVLVLAQLFNTLNARSEFHSAFRGLFANRWLWSAIAVSALLQVAVVQWSLLNQIFTTVRLSCWQWLFCLLLASTVLWAAELHKLALRFVARRRGACQPHGPNVR